MGQGTATVESVTPGLFAANANGQGVPAGVVLRVKADNTQTFEPLAEFNQAQNRFVPRPIDLGPATDQVFLILFGTGIKLRSSLSAVSCNIGGIDSQVLYAGEQGFFVGLDQINVRLPANVPPGSRTPLMVSMGGESALPVFLAIR